MFFGMTNSLATFQTIMKNVFWDLIAEGIVVVMTWQKQLSYYLYFLFFVYLLHIRSAGKCHVTWSLSHMTKLHEKCGKIVHRPCSSFISIQEINKDSIE